MGRSAPGVRKTAEGGSRQRHLPGVLSESACRLRPIARVGGVHGRAGLGYWDIQANLNGCFNSDSKSGHLRWQAPELRLAKVRALCSSGQTKAGEQEH